MRYGCQQAVPARAKEGTQFKLRLFPQL
jgi:hypothetical protein